MAYELEMLLNFLSVVFNSLAVQILLVVAAANEIQKTYRVNTRSMREWNRLYPKYRVKTEYFDPKRKI